MAPMLRQETAEVLEDYLNMVEFNDFGLPAGEDLMLFDNTKLLEDNGLGLNLNQQPGVVVQPASPQQQLSAEDCYVNYDFQPGSPEFLVMQPAVPEPSLQQTLTPAPVFQQAPTPEPVFQQALTPEPVFQQALTPEPVFQQALTPEPVFQQALSPAPSSNEILNPGSCDIEVQPENYQLPEFLDLLGLPASFDIVSASQDSLAMSPQVLCKEEPASPDSQQGADSPKKRGRKRKYPEGEAPSRRRSNKQKVYEMAPLADEEGEKKRRNAVNAKRHRDMQKQEKQRLSDDLEKAKQERDLLLQMVNQYKQREQQLLHALNGSGIKVEALHTSLDGF